MFQKQSRILIIISIILVLFGCNSIETGVNFNGKSEHWLGTYTISSSPVKGTYTGTWKFTYIGKEKPIDQNINYTIDGESVHASGNGKMTIPSVEGSASTYKYPKNEKINVTIKWDNSVEQMTLQR